MRTMRLDLDEPRWLRPRWQGEHPDRLGGEVTRFVAVIDRDLCLHVLVGWC